MFILSKDSWWSGPVTLVEFWLAWRGIDSGHSFMGHGVFKVGVQREYRLVLTADFIVCLDIVCV